MADRPAVAALAALLRELTSRDELAGILASADAAAEWLLAHGVSVGAALEAPPTLTDAQAWELWEQLGSRDVSGFATKREVADWVRAVVGRYVRGEAPPEPTVDEVLALAERMPPDVFAAVEQGDFTLRMLLRIVAGQLGGWQARGGRGEAGPLPPRENPGRVAVSGGTDGGVGAQSPPVSPASAIHDAIAALDDGALEVMRGELALPSGAAFHRDTLRRYLTHGVRGVVPAPPPPDQTYEARSELLALVAAYGKAQFECGNTWDEGTEDREPQRRSDAAWRDLRERILGRAVPAPQEGPPGVAEYERLLRTTTPHEGPL